MAGGSGFNKEIIFLSEITEVYKTHNPISSSAASLDRVLIKSRRKELMCSVKNKEKIFECLKEKNPQIQFSPQNKNDMALEASACLWGILKIKSSEITQDIYIKIAMQGSY